MGLSEQEQRMLDEIESALYAEDPKFTSTMSGNAFTFSEEGGQKRGFSIQVIALIALGLLMLLGGVALFSVSHWFIALSIAGFGLMFGAGIWALTGSPKPGAKSSNRSSAKGGATVGQRFGRAPRNVGQAKGGDGPTLEDRFRDRFER